MTPAITLEELLAWNEEVSRFWKIHLDANPALLELPCGIGGNADVQAFIRHIWGAELVWSQIISGLLITDYDVWPHGPLAALYDLHLSAVRNFRALFANAEIQWDEKTVHYPWRRPETPKPLRARLWLTHCCTVSAIGRSFPLWSALMGFHLDFWVTCC